MISAFVALSVAACVVMVIRERFIKTLKLKIAALEIELEMERSRK